MSMTQKHKKAFTLVELLIVIIIIGILAGMMMISSGSATDTAEKTRCTADRRSLRSALNLYRAEKGAIATADIKTALDYVLKNNFDNIRGAVQGDNEITGICPTGGKYTVTASDDRIMIACSKHNNDNEQLNATNVIDFTEQLLSMKNSDVKFMEFLKRLGNNNSGSLNSEGVNYGSLITEALSATLGLDMTKYSWRLWFNTGHTEYQVYWTKNISKLAPGDKVEAFKVTYNVSNNTFSAVTTGTVSIGTETIKGNSDNKDHTYNIILGNTFQATK